MPNIKSAKKRVIVNQKKTEQNKNIRSAVRTEIKKIESLIKENNVAEAKALLPHVFSMIDSAASKNIIHANNAANKKARLAKKIDSAAPAAAPVAEEPKAKAKTAKAPKAKAVEEPKAEAETAIETPAEAPAEEPVKKTVRKPRAKKTTEEKAE